MQIQFANEAVQSKYSKFVYLKNVFNIDLFYLFVYKKKVCNRWHCLPDIPGVLFQENK